MSGGEPPRIYKPFARFHTHNMEKAPYRPEQ